MKVNWKLKRNLVNVGAPSGDKSLRIFHEKPVSERKLHPMKIFSKLYARTDH